MALNANTDPLDTKAVYGNDIDAMEFEDFKASIHNIERETSAVYNDLCTQETHNIKPTTTRPHPETSLEDRLCNIEALLKEAEATRQREYTQTTKKLISVTKANLLDIEARHGDDIEASELDALRASLDYATFNTNLIYMSPHTKKINIYTYILEDLRDRISVRIFATKRLLTELVSPIQIQNLPQELAYKGYIKRSRKLTQEAYFDILDIEANYRKDILPTELEDIRTSLHNINASSLQSTVTCAH